MRGNDAALKPPGGRRGDSGRAVERGVRGVPFRSRRRFVATCAVYLTVVCGFSGLLLLAPVQEHAIAPFIAQLARAVSFALGLLGVAATSQGTDIVGPNLAVRIVNECTGIEALILLVAAILVFPGSWRARGVGVLLAVGVMASVNFVRIVSLCWVGTFSPRALELGHLYLWPVVVMLLALLTLMFWAQRFAVARR